MSMWFPRNGKFGQSLETLCQKQEWLHVKRRCRQCALISDFLLLASLSIREEAAVTTNWIKDRPEGTKLQNLPLATMTGPVLSSLLRNLTADVQYAIEKGESLGPGQQLILHGNPSAFAAKFSPHMAVLRRHFCRICSLSAVCCFRAPSLATLISLRPAVNPLLGYSCGNPFKSSWREGLSCSPIQLSSIPHLIRARGQWLCSGKKILDVSLS